MNRRQSPTTYPLHPAAISKKNNACTEARHFKATLKRAGLPATVSLRNLRHSGAPLLIAQEGHMRVAMQVRRHQPISTTIHMYGHVYEKNQRGAVAEIDALFQRKGV